MANTKTAVEKKSSHWHSVVNPISKAAMEFGGTTDKSQSEILKIVSSFYKFGSVCDLGTGTGRWLRASMDMGINDIRGYDIPEIDVQQRDFPAEKFYPADLSQPITVDRTFDLAISTEVAEHIPPEGVKNFVANLCQLSSVVLFSAALPYQGGAGHVNENWVEYWAKLFLEHDYDCYDIIRFKIWHNTSIRSYYRQNILLFSNRKNNKILLKNGLEPTKNPLSFIHPEQYIKAINRPRHPEEKYTERDVKMYYHAVFDEIEYFIEHEQNYHYGQDNLGYKP